MPNVRDRLRAKRREKSAIRKKARLKLTKEVEKEYLRMRRMSGGQLSLSSDMEIDDAPEVKQSSDQLSLDDSFLHPGCSGVGQCCIQRFLPVEPSDIWRLLRNEAVRDKWGVKHTMDLFGAKKPLIYDISSNNGMPGCATIRVAAKIKGKDVQVCPFLDVIPYEHGIEGVQLHCILGDDRLTFCKPDPLTRSSRLDGRRHAGWLYTNNSSVCLGCMYRPSKVVNGEMRVEEWLVNNGMEERYMFTDLFLGYMEWVMQNTKSVFQRKLAAILIFDWHRFLSDLSGQLLDEVPWDEPGDPREILMLARAVMEGVIEHDVRGMDNPDDTYSGKS